MAFSEKKFFSLDRAAQHKKCYELLTRIHVESNKESLYLEYNTLASWMKLSPLSFLDYEAFEERFHVHVTESNHPLREPHFLASLSTQDKEEGQPFANIWTYLDSLRSAHNIGSIVRTVEAFRLGPIRLGGSTLVDPKDQKIYATSMGSLPYVNLSHATSLSELPRPWIALETVRDAPSLYETHFPLSATLFVGNEERGVSKALLTEVDHIIQIPLFGRKNSLNVSCAFAILASYVAQEIRR